MTFLTLEYNAMLNVKLFMVFCINSNYVYLYKTFA